MKGREILQESVERGKLFGAAGDNSLVSGKSATAVIHDLAMQAGAATEAEIIAAGEAAQMDKGATEDLLVLMRKVSDLIASMKKQRDEHLSDLRLTRMALTVEAEGIEKALKRIKDMNLSQLLKDLTTLCEVLERPAIKGLLRHE